MRSDDGLFVESASMKKCSSVIGESISSVRLYIVQSKSG